VRACEGSAHDHDAVHLTKGAGSPHTAVLCSVCVCVHFPLIVCHTTLCVRAGVGGAHHHDAVQLAGRACGHCRCGACHFKRHPRQGTEDSGGVRRSQPGRHMELCMQTWSCACTIRQTHGAVHAQSGRHMELCMHNQADTWSCACTIRQTHGAVHAHGC